jgi:hypothetical protein
LWVRLRAYPRVKHLKGRHRNVLECSKIIPVAKM